MHFVSSHQLAELDWSLTVSKTIYICRNLSSLDVQVKEFPQNESIYSNKVTETRKYGSQWRDANTDKMFSCSVKNQLMIIYTSWK